MQANTVTAENFSFMAESGKTYITAKGSKLTIPANAFRKSNGALVTGLVDFKIIEVFSPKDMIFSGIMPISYGLVLNSGGEFYMEARSNGEKVRMADGKFVNLVIPAQAIDANMQLFMAQGDAEADSVNWEAQDTFAQDTNGGNRGNFGGSFTFSSADKTYNIEMDSLGWGNIDAFNWNIIYFNCTFDLTGVSGLNSSNTSAFAVFKDQNSVWPMGVGGWGDITNNKITETHLGSVPMNIVVISVVDEQLYYGLLDITPVDGVNYSIAMSKTTKADLDTLIKGL
jgi:hypothetical protein